MSKGITTILLIVIIFAVGIIGASVGYYYGIKVATPTGVTTTTTAVDVTANWKTYTNDQYGFSFKYPDGFNPLVRTKSKEGKFAVDIDYPTGGLSRSTLIAIYDGTLESRVNYIQSLNGYKIAPDTLISGKSWKTFLYDPKDDPNVGDQSKTKTYITQKNGDIFQISVNYDTGLENYSVQEANKIIDQILSTFRFDSK